MGVSDVVFNVAGIFLLLLGSAFFSGSETALSALSKIQILRIRKDKRKSSKAVIRFLDEPRRLFISVLFGNTLVNMAFVSTTGSIIYNQVFRGQNAALAYIVAILIQTLVLLICGEITPKTFAIKHAVKLSGLVARPLWLFSQFIYPFRKALQFFTDILLPFFGVRSVVDRTPITSEEIKASVKATEEYGALSPKEGELLYGIFDLQDTKVREIMVPRTQMICIEVSETVQTAFQKAREAGHSRLPVYRDEADNICGIFYVKDLPQWKRIKADKLGKKRFEELTLDGFLTNQDILNALNPEHKNTLIRPPFFVYKTRDIGSLMREMNRKKKQMAIVLDEYGGVSGLVTVEDIVEEVVGEIIDEYDAIPLKKITRDSSDPATHLVPGSVSLRTVNRALKLKLDIAVADTISGYVTSLLGSIPITGDVLVDAQNNVKFEVLRMEGRRIDLLRIHQLKTNKGKRKSFFSLGLPLCLLSVTPLAELQASHGHSQGALSPGIFIALLILALGLLAFYAGSETAIVSASKARIDVLAQQNNKRALFIKKLMQEPDKMLGIVLVGSNLMATAAGVAGLRLTHYILSGKENLQEVANTLAMTFLILFFCEILPKTIFRAKADSLALKSAGTLKFSAVILRPLVSFVTSISNTIVRIAKEDEEGEKLRIMREELWLLAKMGQEEGALKKAQLRMIHSILDLGSRSIEKIMTPLVDIVAVPEDIETQDFLDRVTETGFSRIPVFRDRIDNMIGIVNVLDVLYSEEPSLVISSFIRKDLRHEPRTKRIFPLLRELVGSQYPMVFVVDEYGGIIGLVTIEDLVEEIMGDIQDEKDTLEEETIRRISERVFDCDGKAEIQTLNHAFGLNIPEGGYITIAGYVVQEMQKIPKKGEILETDDIKILVLDADAKRVKQVRILQKQ